MVTAVLRERRSQHQKSVTQGAAVALSRGPAVLIFTLSPPVHRKEVRYFQLQSERQRSEERKSE
jgi:hypothetical protein